MPALVVDASVMAASIFREPRAEEANQLLVDAEVYVPFILGFELANVAWNKARRFPGKQSLILEALQRALSIDFRWTPVDYHETAQLALQMGLSAYDASYLYVATVLDLPLVTFDKRLAQAYNG